MEPPADTGKVEGEGDSVSHGNWARRFVVDIAFHLAYPHSPLAEGCPPNVCLAGHHRPHEGYAAPGHVTGREQAEGMCLLRWDWLVEMGPDDKPWDCRVRGRLGICDLFRKLEATIVGQ